ncbi:SDR family oxidoreductase [Deinococcus roseus]|uniref:Nucleotide-diphosphate-sugar epimerase n=1 Tax=Deinococcus roseus TaxID=392414 RepID=A0ABQ2D1V1_9DEIO|nr:NAD(P)H-binding protein [Deinococcus roseus]GGJ41219.1 nucleotide-diphosphate-sugar epimerase [Deinococcus roseus]
MKRVLVTGGTGVLGKEVVEALKARGSIPRVLSRKNILSWPGVETVQGDLTTGAGVEAALKDVEVVIHCAHNPTHARQNTLATQNLLKAVQQSSVKHVVLISIIGIDRLTFYPYYKAKLQDEQVLESSGIPYTILRAAQFHDFVGFLIQSIVKSPLILLPRDLPFQPVGLSAVAETLAQAALQAPAGRLPDLAGPEVLTLDQLTHSFLKAQGIQKTMYTFPLPLSVFKVFRELASSQVTRKGETWQEWLSRRSQTTNAYQKAQG